MVPDVHPRSRAALSKEGIPNGEPSVPLWGRRAPASPGPPVSGSRPLGGALVLSSPREFDHQTLGYHGRRVMQQMDIYGVSFDLVGKQPIVLLKTQDGNKFLPIWIGHSEAAAILMRIQGANTPRPMTHDLLSEVLGQLDAEVIRVAVTELRDNTFFAVITVQQNGSEIEIDSRPSDAIALAVRAEAPIFVADEVIEESAIEFEGEEGEAPDISQMSPEQQAELRQEFREFLENVTPDQFAEAEAEPGEDA